MSGLRFDTIVDFAGTGTTTAAAVNAMKPGGRIVLVGLSAKEVSLNTYDLVSRGISLKGSAGSSLEELAIVLGLIANGKLIPRLEEIPFSDIANSLVRLAKGDSLGRLYADPSKS